MIHRAGVAFVFAFVLVAIGCKSGGASDGAPSGVEPEEGRPAAGRSCPALSISYRGEELTPASAHAYIIMEGERLFGTVVGVYGQEVDCAHALASAKFGAAAEVWFMEFVISGEGPKRNAIQISGFTQFFGNAMRLTTEATEVGEAVTICIPEAISFRHRGRGYSVVGELTASNCGIRKL